MLLGKKEKKKNKRIMLLFRSYFACIKRKIAVYRFIPKRQKSGAKRKYESMEQKKEKEKNI